MAERRVELRQEWVVGEQIGGGGFGAVYRGWSDSESVAIKFVPKAPGADRELLFVDLPAVRNVVPVIDKGETDTDYVLVMPRAERSLEHHLYDIAGPVDPQDALTILSDIAVALSDLSEGGVVHRDLKPANVLYLAEKWCLADFGISRYAEATTAPDTQKYAMSVAYAAPERWRAQRATPATDVYAFGVIAHEMLSGEPPFRGPDVHDFRDQHLHDDPPPLGVGVALGALVSECMYKSPQTRPSGANLVARLERLAADPPSGGLARLQEANRAEVQRHAESARVASAARTEQERRADLVADARRSLEPISQALLQQLVDNAPAATVIRSAQGGWILALGRADLQLSAMAPVERDSLASFGGQAPFDVIGSCSIQVEMRQVLHQSYRGRSHSLWFCDAQEEGRYAWFETAFMRLALGGSSGSSPAIHPFAVPPTSTDAGEALSPGMNVTQVAWPFTPLVIGEMDDLIGRWADWLASASEGRLAYPSHMPERRPDGSYRR